VFRARTRAVDLTVPSERHRAIGIAVDSTHYRTVFEGSRPPRYLPRSNCSAQSVIPAIRAAIRSSPSLAGL